MVDSFAKVISKSRARYSRANLPISSIFLREIIKISRECISLGPTSVGKAELAKTLALELFDSSKAIVRIHMSEYTESHSVARLIGALSGTNKFLFIFFMIDGF